MKKVVFALALLAAAAHAQQPLGFKGVPFGASKAELLARFPALRCEPAKAEWLQGDERCFGTDASVRDYGGEMAQDWVRFSLVGGSFEGFDLSFRWTRYGGLRDALIAAYGPGVEQVQSLQALRGTPFPSRVWVVKTEQGSLTLLERSVDDTGSVFAASPKFNEWLRIRNPKPGQV